MVILCSNSFFDTFSLLILKVFERLAEKLTFNVKDRDPKPKTLDVAFRTAVGWIHINDGRFPIPVQAKLNSLTRVMDVTIMPPR